MTLLRMRLAPIAWNARKVRDHLVRVSTTMDMSSGRLEEFVTAIGEAFANAVEHAGTRQAIEIVVRVDTEKRLVASVRDRGKGIDRAAIDQALPPVRAERGRGIPLMRRCTSSMRISLPKSGGTLVSLFWERGLLT